MFIKGLYPMHDNPRKQEEVFDYFQRKLELEKFLQDKKEEDDEDDYGRDEDTIQS